MGTDRVISRQDKNIQICLTETIGLTRNCEYVRVGVPCPKGEIIGTERVQLLSPDSAVQPMQSTILKKWHDGSVKWLLLDFAASVNANESVVYSLVNVDELPPVITNPVRITRSEEYWQVSTGAAEFIVDNKEFRPFRSVTVNGRELLASNGSFCLFGLEGKNLKPIVEKFDLDTEGPMRSIIRIEGRFDSSHNISPRFVCRIHFFAGSNTIQLELTLLNPGAASHPGGLWDLGDSGSILFKEFALHFPINGFEKNQISCSPEPGSIPLQFEQSKGGMRIYQESSGGQNWNSPVHRTRDGNVRLRFNGYEIQNNGENVSSGIRATPVVWCGEGDKGISAAMPNFWKEFPKAFSVVATGLKIELFPAGSPGLHELQGGEQKTTNIYLDFDTTPEGLSWARSPLLAVPSPETCHSSGVFIDLPALPGDADVTDLVDQFVTPYELLSKREAVDEYGWRNFGDLYADHEAVYHKGAMPFVSHYNNQYDVTGGLYRKFFSTGDPKWGVLASDLARHVADIDLYHTEQDREEYNHGLFWHTDHYLDAGLSTHRSCSKEHLAVKDLSFCGGGPGAEHCYTTGFVYHYFQTGNPVFHNVIVDMALWELRALKETHSVLGVLKKSLNYVTMLRNRSQTLFPLYPLTRGTGNAITACLDAYELTGEKRYIVEAEELIRGALHPHDDIDARNLLNAEVAWSYTVLLVAVAKYLFKKMDAEQYDAGYEYARSSLLAYVEWMLVHEYPYLEKPEILEYPNETWAAQDLRKSVIFFYAAHFGTPDRVPAFIDRARFFFNTASLELLRHSTSSLARPVVLMLQNGWVGSRLATDVITPMLVKGRELTTTVPGPPTPHLTAGAVVSRIASELMIALRHTSIKREIAWLKARIG